MIIATIKLTSGIVCFRSSHKRKHTYFLHNVVSTEWSVRLDDAFTHCKSFAGLLTGQCLTSIGLCGHHETLSLIFVKLLDSNRPVIFRSFYIARMLYTAQCPITSELNSLKHQYWLSAVPHIGGSLQLRRESGFLNEDHNALFSFSEWESHTDLPIRLPTEFIKRRINLEFESRYNFALNSVRWAM